MELVRVVYRARNDFHWDGRCRHCGHVERYGDGYADNYYCTRVVPNRHCPACSKNCYGVSNRMIEPSDDERATWQVATDDYVRDLETSHQLLQALIDRLRTGGVILECMGPRVPLLELLNTQEDEDVLKQIKELGINV